MDQVYLYFGYCPIYYIPLPTTTETTRASTGMHARVEVPRIAMTLRSGATTLSRTKGRTRSKKVGMLTGIRKRCGMGEGNGGGRPRRNCVGFLVAVKLFSISMKKLLQSLCDSLVVFVDRIRASLHLVVL